jgi:hypothetical protein
MNDHEAISRGHRAFAEYSELEAVFTMLEDGIIREMKNTPIGQDSKVLRLHMSLDVVAGVRAGLRAMIDGRLLAEHALGVAELNRPN